jgi:hypothetical protein
VRLSNAGWMDKHLQAAGRRESNFPKTLSLTVIPVKWVDGESGTVAAFDLAGDRGKPWSRPWYKQRRNHLTAREPKSDADHSRRARLDRPPSASPQVAQSIIAPK